MRFAIELKPGFGRFSCIRAGKGYRSTMCPKYWYPFRGPERISHAHNLRYFVLSLAIAAARGRTITNGHQSLQAPAEYIGKQAKIASLRVPTHKRAEIIDMYVPNATSGRSR